MKSFKCNKGTDDTLNPKLITTCCKRKVENYKLLVQLLDRQSKQQVPKHGYVNAEWLLNNITSH